MSSLFHSVCHVCWCMKVLNMRCSAMSDKVDLLKMFMIWAGMLSGPAVLLVDAVRSAASSSWTDMSSVNVRGWLSVKLVRSLGALLELNAAL